MTVSWLSNLRFGILTNLTQIKHSLACESDKRHGNELFVCSKYASQRPLLATVVVKLYFDNIKFCYIL